jgi:dienelactone hydrolase
VLSPAGGAPHPAVLFVPGCSGFVAHNGVNLYDERAAELQAAGYFVVFVDYLGRRNLRNCDGHFSHAEVGRDILEAATWIRGQPDVDASRIAVIGWSYGGGAVLAALQAMPPGAAIFAKSVMYYPDCRGAIPWSAGVAALMLLGAIDEVAPPALCDAVVKGVPANRLRAITYPNARHGFDSRGLPERLQQGFATIGYSAEAAKASWATVLDFLK